MAGHGRQGSVDVLRKLLILAALVAAIWLLHRMGTPPSHFDPTAVLSFGFVLLAAYTIGELAEAVRLPHITGYLIAGLLVGPSLAQEVGRFLPQLPAPFHEGILTDAVKDQLVRLDDLALALIALTAGGELKVDGLRKGLRTYVGLVLAQAAMVLTLVTALLLLIGGMVPAFTLPPLAQVGDTTKILGLGLVLGSISVATSPAATIAVINGSGARSSFATTVLSVVVLKELFVITAFSAALTVTASLFGVGGGSFGDSLLRIGASMLLGGAVGFTIDRYLRYIGSETLLFLVSLIFTATWGAQSYHLEPALIFIFAGFFVANFSNQGERLIEQVERLGLPVYVVFFALAGAKLHLDVLASLAPFALALVAVRALALYAATTLAARALGEDKPLQNYGWMGFISQAGLAITLANTVARTLPGEVGQGLFSLILGAVAINEIIGPVALQWSLGLSGSLDPKVNPETSEGAQPKTGDRGGWESPNNPADPWGPPPATGARSIDSAAQEVEEELRNMAGDLSRGPVERRRQDADAFLRNLRRDFLRFHRHLAVSLQGGDAGPALHAVIRSELTELSDRWRDLVLDRAARLTRGESWSPQGLVERLDALSAGVPERARAPVAPQSMLARPEDIVRRTLRGLLRLRARVGPVSRDVPLRDLLRYHLGGHGPQRIESIAALLASGDLHLAGRTSALFEQIARTYGSIASEPAESREGALDQLAKARRDVEEEFEFALSEVAQIARDGAQRSHVALGGLMKEIKRDLAILGTLDLPRWRRRYSLVFQERTEAVRSLGTGWKGAMGALGARHQALALELELVALEGRIHDAVQAFAQERARAVKGRLVKQLERVETGLADALHRADEALQELDTPPDRAAANLRLSFEPLRHALPDTARSVRQLIDDLGEEHQAAPLLQAVVHAGQSLTDFYVVPVGRTLLGEWRLVSALKTQEVPFRELAVGYLEATLSHQLRGAARETAAHAASTLALLEELERVVQFNLDLAAGEVEIAEAGSHRELARELLSGALGRSHARIRRQLEDLRPLPGQAQQQITSLVLGELRHLRHAVLDGRATDLRRMVPGEQRSEGRPGEGRRAAAAGLRQATQLTGRLLHEVLGPDRLRRWRERLGLPSGANPAPERLRAPEPAAVVPPVYIRLFSEAAFEAPDLLRGVRDDLGRLRAAIAPSGGGSAALVGHDTTRQRVLLQALKRGVEDGWTEWDLEGPTSAAELRAWIAAAPPRGVLVLRDLHWLLRLDATTSEALDALLQALVTSPPHRRWLLLAQPRPWRAAIQLSALGSAVAEVVEQQPLAPADLAEAILRRHTMSSFDLDFSDHVDLDWQFARLGSTSTSPGDRRRDAWFQACHRASGGSLSDALRLWLASIDQVDDANARLRIGPAPADPAAELAALPETELLLLHQIARQGWVDRRTASVWLATHETAAQAALQALARRGLLDFQEDRGQVRSHLRGGLDRVFLSRGWP